MAETPLQLARRVRATMEAAKLDEGGYSTDGTPSPEDVLALCAAVEAAARADRMAWTREAPTEPGTYWMRDTTDLDDEPWAVSVESYGDRLAMFLPGDDTVYPLTDGTPRLWSGPLVPPVEDGT